MDKVLDKEVHQLYKAPSLSNYLSRQAIGTSQATAAAAAAANASAAAANGWDLIVACSIDTRVLVYLM